MRIILIVVSFYTAFIAFLVTGVTSTVWTVRLVSILIFFASIISEIMEYKSTQRLIKKQGEAIRKLAETSEELNRLLMQKTLRHANN